MSYQERKAMRARPDLIVYSPSHEIQLVAEIKNKIESSSDWATRFRRNLLAHGAIPPARFFLLVLRDWLYLWSDDSNGEEKAATFTARTEEVLGPYLERWRNQRLTESSFELLVKSWLNDIVHSDLARDSAPEELAWLFDSGLYDAIRHGHVEYEPVA